MRQLERDFGGAAVLTLIAPLAFVLLRPVIRIDPPLLPVPSTMSNVVALWLGTHNGQRRRWQYVSPGRFQSMWYMHKCDRCLQTSFLSFFWFVVCVTQSTKSIRFHECDLHSFQLIFSINLPKKEGRVTLKNSENNIWCCTRISTKNFKFNIFFFLFQIENNNDEYRHFESPKECLCRWWCTMPGPHVTLTLFIQEETF